MKVLVTGATGFVGPAVANAIVDAGHHVRVLERKPGSWQESGIRCQEAVQGDVTDLNSLRQATEGIDVVVHLVAIRQGKPEQFQRVMIGGTRNLIAASKERGVGRFVLMSALGTTEQSKDLGLLLEDLSSQGGLRPRSSNPESAALGDQSETGLPCRPEKR